LIERERERERERETERERDTLVQKIRNEKKNNKGRYKPISK